MGQYSEELRRSMEYLSQHPETIFLGQAVQYEGTAMSTSLKNIDEAKKLEMPVNEDMQAGIANGLALAGKIPVSIFPRWNFLLLACNQIINHLDKIPMISEYRPKVIIRTGIGSERPLFPNYQHVGDFTHAFRLMLQTIEVIRLENPIDIFPSYQKALLREDGKSTILVEYGDFHNEK